MKTSSLFLLLILFFLNSVAQSSSKSHPEKGILPFNAPCKTCTEELEKRTGNTREFYALNADGSKAIYVQKSLGNMNYKDQDGFWRTKDSRVIKESENVYAARMQPSPVVIDFENKFASIINGGKEFRFNKNISLVHIAVDGTTTSLGEGNWIDITRSENYLETIFLVQDFYPGIDLQMNTNCGRVETNFILKNSLQYTDGWLVMRQEVEIPGGLHADLSQSVLTGENKRTGSISVVNQAGQPYFTFRKSNAFDAKEGMENNIEMPFALTGNQLDYFVPVNWLKNPSTLYPVTLDPFVYAGDTVPQASVTGSGFTAVCGTLGCSYFMDSLMTPPNCEITNISSYFSYLANLPCIRDDGGFDMTMTNPVGSSCTTRNFTCLGGIQGACFFWPVQLLNAIPPLAPCVLPPQCAPYPLSFELRFRRCNWVPIVPCDATCILANSDWIINIEGRTVETTNVILPQTICEGECTNLAATADWGVPIVQGTNNYTFTWQPGGMVGDVVNVCPTTTTHYMVTVTDLCGMTDTAGTDVIVVPYQNPGFSIAPGDTVCDGTSMMFSANGNAAVNNYDWTISCPTAVNYNNTQFVNYLAPGINANCTATLHYEVDSNAHSCFFDTAQNFVVEFCSGINEFKANDPVTSIYPNPANDHVTIAFLDYGDAKNILLCNVLGERKLEEKDFKGDKVNLDVSGLSKGIYFVKVSIGDQISIHKIILY